jgi:hypothetical protein
MRIVFLFCVLLIFVAGNLEGRLERLVKLDTPSKRIQLIFPDQTHYDISLVRLSHQGGLLEYNRLRDFMGGDVQSEFEGINQPHLIYRVWKGQELLGYIYGVTHPVEFGLIEIFIEYSPLGVIRDLWFQDLPNHEASLYRTERFLGLFRDLTVDDWDQISKMSYEALKNNSDYKGVLRALQLNVLYMKSFLLLGSLKEGLNSGSPLKEGE